MDTGIRAETEGNKQAYATQVAPARPSLRVSPCRRRPRHMWCAVRFGDGEPDVAERDAAITAFGGGDTAGRVAVLRSVTDSNSLTSGFNTAFVQCSTTIPA